MEAIDKFNYLNGNGLINNPCRPLGDQNKSLLRQQLMVFIMNLGLLTGGICLALPSVTLVQLTNPTEEVYLNESQASWFASCSGLSCPLGAFLCGFLADRYGRKKTLILTNILGVLSWALMAFPLKEFGSNSVFLQLIASRLTTGLVKGLGGTTAAVYGAEICLPRIRARLINAPCMAMAGGVLFIYVLGYFIRNNWRLLGMILMGFQIICLLLLIPIRESPSWLMSKGHYEKSRSSLKYLRGLDQEENHKEVEAEFNSMANKLQHKNDEIEISFWKSLKLPQVYKPFILAFIFYTLQQFAGTFVVIVYAVQILTKSGLNIDPFLCGVYIGIARFLVASFIITWQLETWSRRQVGIFSAISMSCCIFLLAATNWFPILKWSYFVASILIAFVVTSAGIWNLPFLICSEIFPQYLRGTCCGISDGFAYFMSFVAIKVFSSMEVAIGIENVFAVYGMVALLTAVFIFLCIPETKGKTLLEIEEYFTNTNGRQCNQCKDVEMKEFFVKTKT